MSHNYLLDLSEYVDTRITALTAGSKQAVGAPEERRRTAGRLDALNGFQALLWQNFFPKLPNRLYRRLSAAAGEASPPEERDDSADAYDDM